MTVEAARELAERNPAVRAGQLALEVMTFYCRRGAITFPLAPEEQ
jgi:hypothetical protein